MKNIPLSLLPNVKPGNPLHGINENIRAISAALESLGGLRTNDAGARSITQEELLRLGVLATDANGNLYNPNKSVPAFQSQIQYTAGRKGQQVFWDISGAKAIGTHVMTGNALPEGAVIIWAMYRVLTPLASSTDAAVVGIGIESDDPDGMVAPVAISDEDNPWDAGSFMCIPNRRDPANDTAPTTATGRKAVLTVSGQALTAGSIVVIAEYVMV